MEGDGPIDPFSEHSLYDVLDGSMPAGASTEYLGLHIISQAAGVHHVQPDGYAGSLGTIQADEHDDVLELVAELNTLHIEWSELQTHGDLADRVERAGKLMTSDPAKADEQPDLYLHVPDNPPEASA